MKIDTHQFFWHYNPEEFAWMPPGFEPIQRDYLPDDLVPLLRSEGIDGTVAVQSRQTLEETRWLLELADQHAFIKGVVGWVDMCSDDVRGQLERFCRHPRLSGLRHRLEDESNDSFALREDFLRGMKTLADFNRPFDFLVRSRHLPVLSELASRFPEQRLVLDHIGKPSIRTGQVSPWDKDIRRLASHPNVYCKISGMVGEADWSNWKPADFRPYLDIVFEAFGTKRLMIGSDWPECTLAGTYGQVLQLVSGYVGQLSRTEQADIWANNAAVVYKI